MAEDDQVFQTYLPFPIALQSVHTVSDYTTTGRHSHCLICLDPFANSNAAIVVHSLPCNITYHRDCLQGWLDQASQAGTAPGCPSCRGPLDQILTPYQETLKHAFTQHSFWLRLDVELLAHELVDAFRFNTSKLGTFLDDLTSSPTRQLLRARASLSWTALKIDASNVVTAALNRELQNLFHAQVSDVYHMLSTSQETSTATRALWTDFYLRELSDELLSDAAALVSRIAHDVRKMILQSSRQFQADVLAGVVDVDDAFQVFTFDRRAILDDLAAHMHDTFDNSIQLPALPRPTPRAWRAWRSNYERNLQHPARRFIWLWDKGTVTSKQRPWLRPGGLAVTN